VGIFDWSALTDKGPNLETNEDFVVAEPGYGIFAVADGMGGRPGGAQASRVAARTFMDALRRVNVSARTDSSVLAAAVTTANASIRAVVAAEPVMEGMGTTLTAVVLSEDRGKIVHVGDSRIYRYSRRRLDQLTDDHTLAGDLIAKGFLSEEVAEHFPGADVLTRAVGTRPTVQPDIYDLVLRRGDWLLLVTDGVYKALSRDRLASLVHERQKGGAAVVARAIMDAAVAAGPEDNLSLVVVRQV
jgi:protein phosphatase